MSERSRLISKLKQSHQYRASYLRAKLNVLIPSQIRALRQKQPMTQEALAGEAGMKQSRISAMERPGATNFNLETLIRLAAAFKVALQVRFVPFSEMLNWENRFSQDGFNVVTVDKDTVFITPPLAAEARDYAPSVGENLAGPQPPERWLQMCERKLPTVAHAQLSTPIGPLRTAEQSCSF